MADTAAPESGMISASKRPGKQTMDGTYWACSLRTNEGNFGVERYGEAPKFVTFRTAHTVYAREYGVSDLVTSESDAEMVIDGLREAVEPTSWAVVGGYAEIQFNADSDGFMVDQTWPGHVSVVRYLSFLREHTTGQQDWPDRLDFAHRNLAPH